MRLVCTEGRCGAVFAGDRGVAALGGTGWAYGFTMVGLCEAVKVSTAKLRVLWLGASGQNSKDGRRAGAIFGGSKPSQAQRILEVAGRFGVASSVDAPVRREVRGATAPVSSGHEPGVTVQGERLRALSTLRQRGARRDTSARAASISRGVSRSIYGVAKTPCAAPKARAEIAERSQPEGGRLVVDRHRGRAGRSVPALVVLSASAAPQPPKSPNFQPFWLTASVSSIWQVHKYSPVNLSNRLCESSVFT
jgi:hypothetical protein